ncbi:MAG: uroporphyrinogen-III C-methyltransferase [Thioalkalivibrio sp.]
MSNDKDKDMIPGPGPGEDQRPAKGADAASDASPTAKPADKKGVAAKAAQGKATAPKGTDAKSQGADVTTGTGKGPSKGDARTQGPDTSPPTGTDGPPSTGAGTAEPPPAAPRGQGAALLIATLAFLLALGVGAALFYLWQQGEDLRASQALQLERMAGELQARGETLSRLDSRLEGETSSREGLADGVNSRLATVEQGLTRLQDRSTRQERGWQLAEVKHLQRMASHRLRLMDDPDGAREALRAADEVLAELGDPRLLPVREALAGEIQALEDLDRPDIPGLALRLERLASDLRPIPLKGQAPLGAERQTLLDAGAPDPAAPWWQRAYAEVRSALAEHVSIRRHAEPIRGLPDAEVELFLRQLLTLRVEAARLALLRRDDAEYQRHLSAATDLMDEHFDAQIGASVRERLEALKAVTLRPLAPDISGSFTRLDELEG